MPSDRIWAIIISAALLTAFVVNMLWQNSLSPRFEAIAVFNGYVDQPGQTQINAGWPPTQWAQIQVTSVIHDDFNYGTNIMSVGLAETMLKTDQGRSLVRNQTYSFHFRFPVFKRSQGFRLLVRELPSAGDN
jgi:hypothetical protein